ncbi:MAG: NfeD family protein [Coriobacteriia bacterium]|nr:NfeD family protein [Coriobacteriia bacterium]
MDPMRIWFWLWILLAAGLLVCEMLTTTLFLLPFAFGAAVAWFLNFINLSLFWQWLAFLVVSVVSLAALRPLARRLTQGETTKSGVDRLIGMDALIIDQPAPVGLRRAKIDGESWNVVLEPGFEQFTGDLVVGERVFVLGIEGTRLVVRRYQ